MRALFESRAAVLKAEAEAKLVEKQIELAATQQMRAEIAGLKALNAELKNENESLKLDLDGWADLHRRFMDNHVAVHALKDELVEALRVAVKLNGFREFNDHIPAMKAALAKVEAGK